MASGDRHNHPNYTTSPRLGQQNRSSGGSDHYRMGNMAQALPGYPINNNSSNSHHPVQSHHQHHPNGPLSPPFYPAGAVQQAPQRSPQPPAYPQQQQQQYSSRNEVFQYPVPNSSPLQNQQQQQPIRKLSSGNNGHANYGSMSLNGKLLLFNHGIFDWSIDLHDWHDWLFIHWPTHSLDWLIWDYFWCFCRSIVARRSAAPSTTASRTAAAARRRKLQYSNGQQ